MNSFDGSYEERDVKEGVGAATIEDGNNWSDAMMQSQVVLDAKKTGSRATPATEDIGSDDWIEAAVAKKEEEGRERIELLYVNACTSPDSK